MRINKRIKVWEAAEKKDSFRPVFEFVYFKDGFAYASDAHIVVRVPVEKLFEGDLTFEPSILNDVLFHASLWKKCSSYDRVDIVVEDDTPVLCVYVDTQKIKISFVRTTEGYKPPKYADIFKEEGGESEPIKKIAFSSALLRRLTTSMGTERVKMFFANERAKIFVYPLNDLETEACGLIMPLTIMND